MDVLLLESGDNTLLESGDDLLLESAGGGGGGIIPIVMRLFRNLRT